MDKPLYKNKPKVEKQVEIYMNTIDPYVSNGKYIDILKIILTTDKKLDEEYLKSISSSSGVEDFLVKLQNCNIIEYNSYNNSYARKPISREFVDKLLSNGVGYNIHSYFLYRSNNKP